MSPYRRNPYAPRCATTGGIRLQTPRRLVRTLAASLWRQVDLSVRAGSTRRRNRRLTQTDRIAMPPSLFRRTAHTLPAGAALLLLLSCGAPVPSDAPGRAYTVNHTNERIVLDGRLDEAPWKQAAQTEPFVLYADGATPTHETRAQLVWDDSTLYLAFTARDTDVWATMADHDEHLWEEEAVELFIDPDADGLDYIELQVNPLATTLDLLMNRAYADGGEGDFEWTFPGFAAAVAVAGSTEPNTEDSGWTVEVALPFSGFRGLTGALPLPPRSGDVWSINLTRMELAHGQPDSREASAWSPTDERGFHAPDRWGRITFADAPAR